MRRRLVALGVLVALGGVLAGPPPAGSITRKWTLNNLANKVKGHVAPIWGLFEKGTSKNVPWQPHADNPRFQIYDPNGNSDPGNTATWSDDMVLDRETGLIWERSPYTFNQGWETAKGACYYRSRGGRYGWRLPAIEELASLMDNPPGTPNDGLARSHPFNIVMTAGYWSSTTDSGAPGSAYALFTEYPEERIFTSSKASTLKVWCVRGGAGNDGW